MNRRNFLLACSALAAGGAASPLAQAAPVEGLHLRRQLGPLSISATFAEPALRHAKLPLALRVSRNSIWLEDLSWTGTDGIARSLPVHRNLPPGACFHLPMAVPVKSLALTLLPLAHAATWLELVTVGQSA